MLVDSKDGPTPEELVRVNEGALAQAVLRNYSDQLRDLKQRLELATALSNRHAEDANELRKEVSRLKQNEEELIHTGFDTLVRRIVTEQVTTEFEERGL